MRYALPFCLLLTVAMPCHAQPKPNTLTAKEIADGWVLLFDGETTFGWQVGFSSSKSDIVVKDGVMDLGGLGDGHIVFIHLFAEFELELEYRSTTDQVGFGFHAPMRPDLTIPRSVSQSPGKRMDWTPIKFRMERGKYTFEVAASKSTTAWGGLARIMFSQNRDAGLKIRNIKLRPLNTTSLFNGKDLTGWNVFPNKKSKFAIVDGAINVKDGPGDLQTVGKYKDFILQLDCISNGKHLNSGIFFRCRDNEYQNGYEAQIRNEFKPEPQKYVVEEYDPKTNKLVGKKEVTSNAFDFGTGAIYRRVPARKQMSKDNEWFTMTIAANGNHFATWVNGVQMTDWTDNRPKSDNARTGCKLDAGHISIQGHDPTTDLSFKNFRIAELK